MDKQQEEQEEDISDEELLRAVEDLERSGKQSGGGSVSNREGYFKFKRTQFREKKAKSYGIKRTSYHLQVQNPEDTFPVRHRNIIGAFEEGLARSIEELIVGLPGHDRIEIYLGSNRLETLILQQMCPLNNGATLWVHPDKCFTTFQIYSIQMKILN